MFKTTVVETGYVQEKHELSWQLDGWRAKCALSLKNPQKEEMAASINGV